MLKDIWIAILLILIIFVSCAKPGQIKLKMPDLPKRDESRSSFSSGDKTPEINQCEISAQKLRDEIQRLKDEVWDLRWGDDSISCYCGDVE